MIMAMMPCACNDSADTSLVAASPAIVVYSVRHGHSYRLLGAHPSMFGPSVFLNVSGQSLGWGPLGLRVHVDSIALDQYAGRLYFGAVTSDKLFSIATTHLIGYVNKAEENNGSVTVAMAKHLEDFVRLVSSNKPATDGIRYAYT